MKKTNKIKTRIIAGLLSTVTAFSVGVIAISSASAAEINSSEYILQQNDANAPVSFATVKAEDYGKQAGNGNPGEDDCRYLTCHLLLIVMLVLGKVIAMVDVPH